MWRPRSVRSMRPRAAATTIHAATRSAADGGPPEITHGARPVPRPDHWRRERAPGQATCSSAPLSRKARGFVAGTPDAPHAPVVCVAISGVRSGKNDCTSPRSAGFLGRAILPTLPLGRRMRLSSPTGLPKNPQPVAVAALPGRPPIAPGCCHLPCLPGSMSRIAEDEARVTRWSERRTSRHRDIAG